MNTQHDRPSTPTLCSQNQERNGDVDVVRVGIRRAEAYLAYEDAIGDASFDQRS
jgi:hypothetical protein